MDFTKDKYVPDLTKERIHAHIWFIVHGCAYYELGVYSMRGANEIREANQVFFRNTQNLFNRKLSGIVIKRFNIGAIPSETPSFSTHMNKRPAPSKYVKLYDINTLA